MMAATRAFDTQAYVAIQQHIHGLFNEIDVDMGTGIANYYTEDGELIVGGKVTKGHAAISAFYVARQQRVLQEQRDGTRTARHLVLNLIIDGNTNNASARFVLLYFSGEGKPPLVGPFAPTIVADCQMQMTSQADGQWRVSRFDSQPLFVGPDPFMLRSIGEPSSN